MLEFELRHPDFRAQRRLILRFIFWPLKMDFVVRIIAALPYFSTYPFFPLKNRSAKCCGEGDSFLQKKCQPRSSVYLVGKKDK